jgi:hypothetical protein
MKAKSSEDIDEWDKEYITVDQGTLFEVILAANYMDMQGLLDLGLSSLSSFDRMQDRRQYDQREKRRRNPQGIIIVSSRLSISPMILLQRRKSKSER